LESPLVHVRDHQIPVAHQDIGLRVIDRADHLFLRGSRFLPLVHRRAELLRHGVEGPTGVSDLVVARDVEPRLVVPVRDSVDHRMQILDGSDYLTADHEEERRSHEKRRQRAGRIEEVDVAIDPRQGLGHWDLHGDGADHLTHDLVRVATEAGLVLDEVRRHPTERHHAVDRLHPDRLFGPGLENLDGLFLEWIPRFVGGIERRATDDPRVEDALFGEFFRHFPGGCGGQGNRIGGAVVLGHLEFARARGLDLAHVLAGDVGAADLDLPLNHDASRMHQVRDVAPHLVAEPEHQPAHDRSDRDGRDGRYLRRESQ
jgi:hypothetical protein